MRKKQLQYTALAAMIILPSFLSDSAKAASEGRVTSKDEVVYATLDANGSLNSVYVVNTLDVERAGEISDYGAYSSVKNLTNLTDIQQEGQNIAIDAPEGKFYYQGNLDESTQLPWNVTVSYLLDGKIISAEELAGKTGSLQININTAQNNEGNSIFYENYLLQVSLVLPNSYQNIEASDGMVANAGKNKQITFTVMPGEEKDLNVTASVEDFEFQGIEIAAVPSTLPIDTSEIDSMTDDMSQLSDAIGELNDGVAKLESGVTELNNGTVSLRNGSAEYQDGMGRLNGSSADLVNGSASIMNALGQINESLSNQSAEMDMSGLAELPAGLTQLAGGLTEVGRNLTVLQESFAAAYAALDGAMGEIPAEQISEEEIAGLYESGADAAVVDKLAASYAAGQKVRATYLGVQEAFAAVEPSLAQLNGSLNEMSSQLTAIAGGLSSSLEETDMSGLGQLQSGIAELSAKYGEFHSGLSSYTNGVDQLSASYGQLHNGLAELTGGTSDLEGGVSELHGGTTELYQETKDLPEQMQNEINERIAQYDKSDFEPVSFVSHQNEQISSVQFVIKTQSIEVEEQETKQAAPQKEKGFWELLKNLFTF